MNDDAALTAAAHLSLELRAWLRRRPETPELHAAALAYELAALIARHAPTVAHAHAVSAFWLDVMRDQITEFGVGDEHP